VVIASPATVTLATMNKQRKCVFWQSMPRSLKGEDLLDRSSVCEEKAFLVGTEKFSLD
jgi:hypothetical protein